jgi:hypothetical protein
VLSKPYTLTLPLSLKGEGIKIEDQREFEKYD